MTGGRSGALVAAALAACRPDPTLPAYGGWPLWVPEDALAPIDLGHAPARAGARAPGPITLVDETVARGLGGATAGGNQHGVAVALVDLDGDGDPEALIVGGISNVTGESTASTLWRNDGGAFVDATDALGGALAGRDGYSVAAGDVDGDGDVDLYVGAQPTNVLLANRGDGTFTDVTRAAGAGATPSDPALVADGRGKIVAIDDVDGDGALDLLSATSTQPPPGATLLRNRGDGTFTDATAATGARIAATGNPCAVLFTDYDNDGLRDLWIWNDRGGHTLLHHDGAAFEDLGDAADRSDARNPMGIDAADLDRDGDLEYYVGNIGPHPLLDNLGNGRFVDLSRAAGTTGDYGWGVGFRDLDADGWVDLVVTQEDTRPTLVYRNRGDRTFARDEVEGPPLRDETAAHNVPAAFGDVDGDGRTDVLIARTDGARVQLLRNVTPLGDDRVLTVRIPGGGVGARVVVRTGDGTQFLDVHGGSSRASQSEHVARFGLGAWDGAELVVVALPGGEIRAWSHVPAGELRAD